MSEKFGVQIFTIRDYLNDANQIRESFKRIKSIGYDYIQTAGAPSVSYKEFGEIARECGLFVCGTHDNLNMMAENPEQAIENHRYLDTKIMGYGGGGFEGSDNSWRTLGYHNDEQLFGTIDKLNKAAANIAPYGYKLTYHNHAWEFAKYKDKLVLQHILDGTDPKKVSICLDLYWAQYGGADVRQLMKELADRIDIIHLKDMARGESEPYMAYVGEGNMYWKGIIEQAKESGVKYFVVEQDVCQDRNPFDCLEKSFEYLSKL